jgi:hypothetical protein
MASTDMNKCVERSGQGCKFSNARDPVELSPAWAEEAAEIVTGTIFGWLPGSEATVQGGEPALPPLLPSVG